MTDEKKLEGIAKWLDELVKDTDDLGKRPFDDDPLSKDEIIELKGQRQLALELLIRFHLEENL